VRLNPAQVSQHEDLRGCMRVLGRDPEAFKNPLAESGEGLSPDDLVFFTHLNPLWVVFRHGAISYPNGSMAEDKETIPLKSNIVDRDFVVRNMNSIFIPCINS
jgi:hypothetical protein